MHRSVKTLSVDHTFNSSFGYFSYGMQGEAGTYQKFSSLGGIKGRDNVKEISSKDIA